MTSSNHTPPQSPRPPTPIEEAAAMAAAAKTASASSVKAVNKTLPHSQIHGHGHGKKPSTSKHQINAHTAPHGRKPVGTKTPVHPRTKPTRRAHPVINYAKLMRLDKPVGILLLLWPTLWSLWLAAKGIPRLDLLVIFTLGVIVMRSAGCVINDFADRKIDGQVHRTQGRPLATGAVSSAEALILFAVLCLIAFGLVLLTDILTIKLSVVGLLLAFIYPFMKRHTHLPQVVLGAAFAWSIPMAFAAQSGKLTADVGLLYLAVMLWTVVYDTFYAMVDRDDDIKIGVKSTAVLFGDQAPVITGALQVMTLLALILIAPRFGLGLYYYISLVFVAALFAYQQVLISDDRPGNCFKAFTNNNWVGAVIFTGIAIDFHLK